MKSTELPRMWEFPDGVDYLYLKWGELKASCINDFEVYALSDVYCNENNPTNKKEILCKIIDRINCENIYICDDDTPIMSKQQAKDYVMNY